MTIKRRFIFSYISAILITLGSLLLILSLTFYITLGKVPSVQDMYKILTTQRSLTADEQKSFEELNNYVQKSTEFVNEPLKEDVKQTIKEIEKRQLNVVIRKNNQFIYFSQDLIEKSLQFHAPDYELSNFEPIGTIDNAGRLYHYIKHDFKYLDGTNGSFIILRRESNLFEFFTRQGIWLISTIILFAILLAIFINRRLTKTTVKPLENLAVATQIASFDNKQDYQALIASFPQPEISQDVAHIQSSFKMMWQTIEKNNQLQKQYEDNRRELIANMSHDLKTPITSIIGYVEGLRDGIANTEEKRQEYLNTIHQKAISLNELIETLFLYSKLDMENAVINKEITDINRLLRLITNDYQLNNQAEWKINLPQHEILTEIDPLQMTRVLTNIIENSLKFKQPAKQRATISIDLRTNGSYVAITIKDNGIGISEEQLPIVFERFYRADKSRTPTIKGSGLGLNIVKSIMEHHDGSVSITSKLNEGTEVVLTLPLIKETTL
ncbi:sensor histidine kinase [Vagococcus vulneris]|uniref:histidine kinase n=1 Tax=Vagococcus vulneris TaxID=1977869 RepID=A0A429ZUJ3_9ENTE|nr:HAMP domain-containing sensor histidine kinase [Vagococcus vulneris]RST97315.1 two-component sensor histidine kinase [Vagococcus vulneris]